MRHRNSDALAQSVVVSVLTASVTRTHRHRERRWRIRDDAPTSVQPPWESIKTATAPNRITMPLRHSYYVDRGVIDE